MKNIADSKKYLKYRKSLERYFNDGSKRSTKSFVSESGNFTLNVTEYETKKGTSNCTMGIVRGKDGNEITCIKRNYNSFPFLFVEHSNGNEYLICGEDHQGYMIINLTKRKVHNYVPEAWNGGMGFCWVGHKFFPENMQLQVEGCFWACPYEIVTYDFSDPDTVPLKELNRKYADEEDY